MTYEQTNERLLGILTKNTLVYIFSDDDLKNIMAAISKQIAKPIVSDGEDESDWVHCPECSEILGINESVYNAFYENQWKPVYCHKCGQALIWR